MDKREKDKEKEERRERDRDREKLRERERERERRHRDRDREIGKYLINRNAEENNECFAGREARSSRHSHHRR